MPMASTQRILDPIHGLIAFREQDPIDQLAWSLVNTREFQRLRRVRQLGFSELVFPGATHTRFSHCIGVYHTARQLLEVIRRKVGRLDDRRQWVASCAALLHDLGHGPFSHTFERVEKSRGARKRHEEWTAEMIRGETEVRQILDGVDGNLAAEVATLLTQREPKDVYSSIVSSQFDADRLDYLRRDRYMTGAGGGGFDFQWLVDCLEVGKITVRPGEDSDYVEVDGLYLNYKGLQTAEAYLLARHHLYAQVYYHKTTRSAEAMLSALLARVARQVQQGELSATGLPETHALVRYFRSTQADLSAYFALDDAVVWSALADLASAGDEKIAQLARGLRDRKLFKCFDVGALAKASGGDFVPRFRKKLRDSQGELGLEEHVTLLSDEATITAYGAHGFEEPGALQSVLVGTKTHPNRPEDIASFSPIVAAIKDQKLFRVFVPSAEHVRQLEQLWRETTK